MGEKDVKNINAFIKQFIALSCFFAVITIFLAYSVSVITERSDVDTSVAPSSTDIVVVIDPGHGGEDGGAVSADGTVEKELNLAFSKNIKAICDVLGIKTILTRDTDVMLYDKYSELNDYTGKKKVYDLKNRIRFTSEAGDKTVFVGIHMNKFSDPRFSGTQVYYSPNNADSERLANTVKNTITRAIQPSNKREIKKAGSSIFLLKRLKVPAVLIECGFLSNETETALLKSTEYKKEFSLATAVAIGEFSATYNG